MHEKCAVVGYVTDNPEQRAAERAYSGLYALQHRGVEASGIASSDLDGSFHEHRAPGMVRDVYDREKILSLTGQLAIGHNRYSTNGSRKAHLQPVTDDLIRYAMATNGNLPLVDRLRERLEHNNYRTDNFNDSEMMAHAIALELRGGHKLSDAVERAHSLFHGAYSTVAMHNGIIVAFRDPMGVRPLELGEHESGYAVASETSGIKGMGAEHSRSIKPGEMVVITPREVDSVQLAGGEEKLDIFEFVYFARPDSMIYNQRVAVVRYRMGEQLAEQYSELANLENALVVPVPDTSIHAAEGFAKTLGLDYTAGAVVKNRYVGRTFMLPSQDMRELSLEIKHSIIPEFVEGKHLIFVDDSIVRINTAPMITKRAFEAGAADVTFLSASPPVLYPDFYGIDIAEQHELAAANMTLEEMQQRIGAHTLGFLDLSRMVAATGLPAEKFNLAAFNGEYPIDIGRHRDEIREPVETRYLK